MLKATSLILSLTAALQLVLASSVTITSPSPNDVWEAGSTVQIKWKVNEANSKPLRIQYASGPSKALKINGLIADKVNASAGHYNWKVPKGLKAKK
ncbi:hypothetical protein K501DRAFT_166458 [Backusella circina FSU 941]|nr:hypothetical protein K501DRAFT_166458 [Backusella circina FSU 941]